MRVHPECTKKNHRREKEAECTQGLLISCPSNSLATFKQSQCHVSKLVFRSVISACFQAGSVIMRHNVKGKQHFANTPLSKRQILCPCAPCSALVLPCLVLNTYCAYRNHEQALILVLVIYNSTLICWISQDLWRRSSRVSSTKGGNILARGSAHVLRQGTCEATYQHHGYMGGER